MILGCNKVAISMPQNQQLQMTTTWTRIGILHDWERFGDEILIGLLINNYSPKAKWILLNNPRDEVEGIIQQYSLSLRRIIVLV